MKLKSLSFRLAAAAACAASLASVHASAHALPKVTMMVGGIDKQIYLPYQLAQDLGYFRKYGVDMQLSTEQAGGVGAEDAMVSGQVDFAGAWYVHTIDFQQHGKAVVDVAQLSGAPGEREMCTKASGVRTPADWKGKAVGVTDLGSGTDDLTLYLAARYHLTSKEFTRVGVGAEDAMVSGQVDFAGAWYVHTIDFQQHGKAVVDVAQLSGAPGEREMCTKASGVRTPADWKGKAVGVTDLGSGTDDLTLYLAARYHLTSKDFTRVGVGAGQTLIGAMEHGRVACAMTTQPTVNAVEKMGLGYSAIDLATGAGVNKWLGGYWPTAAVLARADWVKAHPQLTQDVVDAMVATMHWIHTHSAEQIADHLPKDFVSNPLSTKAEYVRALDEDKGQFLPDGLMPKGGAQTVLAVEKFAGKIRKPVDLAVTYDNSYALKANAMLKAAGR